MKITFPQSRKAWVSLIGGVVTTAAILWQQYGDVLPGNPQTIAAIGGLLSAVAVFFVPNQLTKAQVAQAQAQPPVTKVPPWTA